MNAPRRLLFVTLSNIGDLVMTTPLLEALHLSFPQHRIDVVADARSSELLTPCPYLGRLLHKDKKAGWRDSWELIATLREHTYDVAVDLRTAFLTLLVRCGQRGIKRRKTSVGSHAVQHHFTALRPILGADIAIPPARLWLDDSSRQSAAEMLSGVAGGRHLVVAPGANWGKKIWPVDHFTALINKRAGAFDAVIVLGSKADRALGDRLQAAVTPPVVNLVGETTLLAAAACMAGATAFVGNDSGLGHMAAALNVPTLTVFGPGRPERYRPWGARAAVVLAPNEDLSALCPSVVAEALDALLARSAGADPAVA